MPYTFALHGSTYKVFENGSTLTYILPFVNYYQLTYNNLSTNLCKNIFREFFTAFPNYPHLPLHKLVWNDNSNRFVYEEILLD